MFVSEVIIIMFDVSGSGYPKVKNKGRVCTRFGWIREVISCSDEKARIG